MSKWIREPFRYNYWLASEYWHDAPNIASRFWDLDPKCDWSLLASVWHSKNDFGRKLDPVFSVQNIFEASKKPEFQVDPIARVIHACWLGYCKGKEDEKPVVILPPPPEPPKVEPKLPQIKLPQEKKNPAPTLVKFSVWFGILATAAGAASFFFPQAKPIVAIVVALVQSILKALGV
jgi:hypothetical protein